MITLEQGFKLSAILDKLGLKMTSVKDGAEQVGADLILQIITKAHKASKEVCSFVAEMKGITPKEAAKVDLGEFIEEFKSDESLMGFFKSAVKSAQRG